MPADTCSSAALLSPETEMVMKQRKPIDILSFLNHSWTNFKHHRTAWILIPARSCTAKTLNVMTASQKCVNTDILPAATVPSFTCSEVKRLIFAVTHHSVSTFLLVHNTDASESFSQGILIPHLGPAANKLFSYSEAHLFYFMVVWRSLFKNVGSDEA